MEKVILCTKNHWKKLGISVIPVIYGINYMKNEYLTHQHMRQVCYAVKEHAVPNHNKVLVLLNPMANKKQCEKMFQKYCEPLLHMVGYEVDVIKTKHVGHAKSFMETLQQLPDVVIVAGGDGTSLEVVTGLARRNKEICPVLFLPLGEKNETSFNLMQSKLEKNTDFLKNVSQCMLALVEGHTEHRPLIKCEVIDNNNIVPNKPIFGIHSFSWGIIKDTEINKDKYWYFGVLRHHASAIFAALSNKLNQNILGNIVYTPPCPGCYKCEPVVTNKSRLNIYKFVSPHLHGQPNYQLPEYKLCSTENFSKIIAKQIDITCEKNSKFFVFKTRIIENNFTLSDFLVNIIREYNIQPSTSFESRTVEVIPDNSEHQIYYIDGECYEARHIKMSLVPNALKYFS